MSAQSGSSYRINLPFGNLHILIKPWNHSIGIFSTEVLVMPKIPRRIFLGVDTRNSENTVDIRNNSELADSSLSDEAISFSSLAEVEWVTNAIEPEQQRGPSETP